MSLCATHNIKMLFDSSDFIVTWCLLIFFLLLFVCRLCVYCLFRLKIMSSQCVGWVEMWDRNSKWSIVLLTTKFSDTNSNFKFQFEIEFVTQCFRNKMENNSLCCWSCISIKTSSHSLLLLFFFFFFFKLRTHIPTQISTQPTQKIPTQSRSIKLKI